MKIYYLTNTFFLDCDTEMLTELGMRQEIHLGVLYPKRGGNFSSEELQDFLKGKDSYSKEILTLNHRKRSPFNMPVYLRLIRTILKGDFDIIYANDFEDLYFRALFLLLIPAGKLVFGVHDAINHSGRKNHFLLDFSKKLFLKKFRKVLTFSASQAECLRTPSNKVFTIPLAMKHFGEIPAGFKKDLPIQFLFFGNIASYKGLDLLINAVKKLEKKYDGFCLNICGRADDWETVYAPLVAGSAIIKSEIRFIANPEIPELFSKAHYLVLPYRDVTQSGPLMIAYNYNVPVIASDHPGFREFVREGVTGYLFKSENEEDLQKVLEKAILRRPEEYKTLIASLTIEAARKYSPKALSGEYEKMFSDAMGTNQFTEIQEQSV